MGDTETCTWTGASGTSYKYFVYELLHTFKKEQNGNYIYAKMVGKKWRPIYIGEGDLGERVSDNHHQAECIKSRNATHVHAHLNLKEQDRLDEEDDLLQNYPQAYKPKGCNEKTGG
jgi:hypothetical protein